MLLGAERKICIFGRSKISVNRNPLLCLEYLDFFRRFSLVDSTLSKEMQAPVKAWPWCGLTKTGYCDQQGLNLKTFSRWSGQMQY